MKKTFVMAFMLAAVAGLVFAGAAFAQDDNPPFVGDRGPRDESGLLHDYMSVAMADALGMTVEELEASHDAGEYFYDLALASDLSEEEISALMLDARTSALDAAAKDGVITQEQADWMKDRGAGRGGMRGGSGVCDGSGLEDGAAGGMSRGGGQGQGGRW
ncbi:MAG: hypothetical protein HOC81_03940 [Candidatus Marinimicrobia bacterium]|jgi:hypothetical protein|nr:hypothetical protein [Candidatus Neomarinimicrobiota bacterium]